MGANNSISDGGMDSYYDAILNNFGCVDVDVFGALWRYTRHAFPF